MSQTETVSSMSLDTDIIEHNEISQLPSLADAKRHLDLSKSETETPETVNKRELARAKRAKLLEEQAHLQRLLDEIEDEGEADLSALQVKMQALSEEVAKWQKPDEHSAVFSHIGIFCLVASLLCWLVAPVLLAHSTYLDGAIHTAAVVLAYVAAGLLLFVQTQKQKH